MDGSPMMRTGQRKDLRSIPASVFDRGGRPMYPRGPPGACMTAALALSWLSVGAVGQLGGHRVCETVTTGAGGPLALSPPAEVDAAEMQFGIRFPAGYREYVTQFGEGVLGGYIRIYPPRRILSGANNVAAWRRRIDQY